jgi:hypothetical protein
VDHIPCFVVDFFYRAIAPTLEQRQQQPLGSARTAFGLLTLDDWLADQPLLGLAHVVFGLRPGLTAAATTASAR